MKMHCKRLLACVVAVFALLSMAGCVVVNYGDAANTKSVRGEGPMVSRSFMVEDYETVYIRGGYDVVYRNQDSDSITIEMQENLFEYVTLEVKDGELEVGSSRGFYTGMGNTPILYLTKTDLRGVTVSGAVTMKEGDTLMGESFFLEVSGSCDAELDVDVDNLRVRVSGAGAVEASGRADSAELWVSGSGDIKALELQTKDAAIQISGAASVSIACSDTLDVQVSGSGDLYYSGSPQVTQRISGAGSVRQVD